jgi:putative membrane protein
MFRKSENGHSESAPTSLYLAPDVPFEGGGWVRPVYFTILTSRIILAAAIVPLVLITLWRALKNNFQRHRRIAV